MRRDQVNQEPSLVALPKILLFAFAHDRADQIAAFCQMIGDPADPLDRLQLPKNPFPFVLTRFPTAAGHFDSTGNIGLRYNPAFFFRGGDHEEASPRQARKIV